MTTEPTTIDPTFKYALAKVPGAEKVMHCFQCGTCTADCPVGLRIKEFRPRQIARLAILGLKEKLYAGDTLWLCAGCFTCYERCPQEVEPTNLITALKTLAVKEGYLHTAMRQILDAMQRYGYIYEMTEFENMIRADIGLPEIPQADVDEVKAIMKKTGFAELTGVTIEEDR